MAGQTRTKTISARVPLDLALMTHSLAENKQRPVTDIVVSALYMYLASEIVGFCRYCCEVNEDSSAFCQRCGRPLTREEEGEISQIVADPGFERLIRRIMQEEFQYCFETYHKP